MSPISLLLKYAILSTIIFYTSGCSYYSAGYYYSSDTHSDAWQAKHVKGNDGGSKGAPVSDKTKYTTQIGHCNVTLESSYQISSGVGLFLIPLFPSGYFDNKHSDLYISFIFKGENCIAVRENLKLTINNKPILSPSTLFKRQWENEEYSSYSLNTGIKVGKAQSLTLHFNDKEPPLILTKKKGQTFVELWTL